MYLKAYKKVKGNKNESINIYFKFRDNTGALFRIIMLAQSKY